MPQNKATAIDPIAGGTFSRLLFPDVDVDDPITLVGFDNTTTDSHFTFSSDQKPTKMLCFGTDYINNKNNNINVVLVSNQNSNTTTTTHDDNNNNNSSSSPTSTTNSTTTSLSSNSNLKRNMGCDYYQPVVLPTTFTTTVAPARTPRRNYKKIKAENTPPASHAKVKKEKLGERIAALQQMVSPYGKTDTASVLHEAMGYIKFLQEQVQVLCSPYLKRLQTTQIVNVEGQEGKGGEGGGERKKINLRSRGLCLVPVEWTLHVAETNGADLWSPAMVNRHGSSPLH